MSLTLANIKKWYSPKKLPKIFNLSELRRDNTFDESERIMTIAFKLDNKEKNQIYKKYNFQVL
jgi:hypothetical protein